MANVVILDDKDMPQYKIGARTVSKNTTMNMMSKKHNFASLSSCRKSTVRYYTNNWICGWYKTGN